MLFSVVAEGNSQNPDACFVNRFNNCSIVGCTYQLVNTSKIDCKCNQSSTGICKQKKQSLSAINKCTDYLTKHCVVNIQYFPAAAEIKNALCKVNQWLRLAV